MTDRREWMKAARAVVKARRATRVAQEAMEDAESAWKLANVLEQAAERKLEEARTGRKAPDYTNWASR